MKRFFAIVLAIVMCVGLAACGNAAQKAASQVTTTAEAATEQLTEETTTEETTQASLTQEEAIEFITNGCCYMVSPQSPSVYECKFYPDGTCTQEYRGHSDQGSSNSSPEYFTYSIEGNLVSIYSEYSTSTWYIDIDENCCWSHNIPWEKRTKYPHFNEQLSQEGIDSLIAGGIERVGSKEPVSDVDKEKLKSISVYDVITFGKYSSDSGYYAQESDIEWIVLEKQGNSLFVISKQAVGNELYNETDTAVTWETCTLRSWLNDEFLNSAFTSEEQAKIQTTDVVAEKNPVYDTDPGNNTKDKIFLLSITEAEKYFTTDLRMVCAGSGGGPVCTTAGGQYACRWWLRTPGIDQQHAAYIFNGKGDYIYEGYNVASIFEPNVADGGGCAGVRPAMWLNFDS